MWILEILTSDLASHLSFISFSTCKDNLCSAQISFRFWASLTNQIAGLGSYRNLKELAGVKKEPVKNWRIYGRLFEFFSKNPENRAYVPKLVLWRFWEPRLRTLSALPDILGGVSVPVCSIRPTQPRTLETGTRMWSVWASRLWSIEDSVVDSVMRLYDCRFILEVLKFRSPHPTWVSFLSPLAQKSILMFSSALQICLFRFWVFVLFDEFVLCGILFCAWWVADTDTGIHHSPSCWRRRDKKRCNEKSCF